jgi:hypothetical protein
VQLKDIKSRRTKSNFGQTPKLKPLKVQNNVILNSKKKKD